MCNGLPIPSEEDDHEDTPGYLNQQPEFWNVTGYWQTHISEEVGAVYEEYWDGPWRMSNAGELEPRLVVTIFVASNTEYLEVTLHAI